jgi:hypothetical protein
MVEVGLMAFLAVGIRAAMVGVVVAGGAWAVGAASFPSAFGIAAVAAAVAMIPQTVQFLRKVHAGPPPPDGRGEHRGGGGSAGVREPRRPVGPNTGLGTTIDIDGV